MADSAGRTVLLGAETRGLREEDLRHLARLCLCWCNRSWGAGAVRGSGTVSALRCFSPDGKRQRLRGCTPTQLSDVDNFLYSTS